LTNSIDLEKKLEIVDRPYVQMIKLGWKGGILEKQSRYISVNRTAGLEDRWKRPTGLVTGRSGGIPGGE